MSNQQNEQNEHDQNVTPWTFDIMFLWMCLGAVTAMAILEPSPVSVSASLIGCGTLWLVTA